MRFEKISFEQWINDWNGINDNKVIESCYNDLKLPQQGTKYSMGMDFFAPCDICLEPYKYQLIPTGIRWVITDPITEGNKGLMLFPRSGQGFKYGIRLANTIACIDADYFLSDNEGHIMVKLFNPFDEPVIIKKGQGYCQGVIVDYCICDGAHSTAIRNGGFGSTDSK